MMKRNATSRRKLSMVIAIALLLTVALPILPAALATSPTILVEVTDATGIPVGGAHVTLWDHSSTPSRNAGTAISDASGQTVFDYPEMIAEEDQLSQHLSVSVYAPGYKAKMTDWSVDRRTVDSSTQYHNNPTNSSINISLEKVPDNSPVAEKQMPGLERSDYRERLAWYDYSSHKDKLTTLATLHQCGDMSVEFRYGSTVTNRFSVQVKYEWDPGFSSTGNVLKSGTTSTGLYWSLPATGSNSKYTTRTCQTYYDYRVEEYYCERYMDRGDGILDWIKVDSYIKVYCHGLSDRASSAGSDILSASAPGTLSSTRDYSVLSTTDWANDIHEQINVGTSISVGGLSAEIGVFHNSQTTKQYKFVNSSSTTAYVGGWDYSGEWRIRPR